MVTLRDLYIAELQDLLDAEQHTLLELPNMAAAATSSGLRELLEEHLEQTRVHIERLELLLRKLDVAGEGKPCDAVHGVLKEGRRRMREGERGDVLDAALVGVAQRLEHYEIAAYGCARTYARTLGDREAGDLLQQTLDEEGGMDARLTKIAQRDINLGAAEDVRHDIDEQRARLRYIPATALPEFKYGEFRIRSHGNEDLGSVDGLIVDARSYQPVYFVVDSGGWFVGQRFLVPIDALRPDEGSRTLRTDLDRKSISTYPPFNAEAYVGPHDDTGAAPAEYRPPTWLMTGVWMTEASGFASVPPRAQADFTPPPADARAEAETGYTRPESELMVARGEPEERASEALDKPPEDRKS